VNDGSGLRTQPAWPSKVFFRATAQTLAGTGNTYYKNLFFSPAAAFAHGKLYVAFGSGERRNLSFPGVAADNGENNAFYVVIDPDPYEQFGNLGVTFDESDLTDFTGSESAASFGITQGFYFTVDDGEKFVTNTTIFSGDVIAASFKPTSSPNPCLSRGDGTLYIFDLVTGEGHFTDGSNNPTRGLSIGGGLPTDPKVSVGVGGSDSKVIIEKSGAEIEIIDEDDVNLGSGSLYWRERL